MYKLLLAICLWLTCLSHGITAQDTASSTESPSPSSSGSDNQSQSQSQSQAQNQTQSVYTTTIVTTFTPTSSGASPVTTSLVITLPLNNTNATTGANSTSTTNSTCSSINTETNTTNITSTPCPSHPSYPLGTLIFSNSTTLFPNNSLYFPNNHTLLNSNGSMYDTENWVMLWDGVWDQTRDWLPFEIRRDPAYIVAGVWLLGTGIPVGVLGGKNRWSSMAIVSGYAVMVFTMVMILCFGVEPGISQSPTPNPPSTTLRGLFTLAVILSSFIGAGVGVFFYNQTKYFVGFAGGFALGWYVEALKGGGVTGDSIVGRWGLIGGLSVVVFIIGLVSTFHHHVILLSTAFIGATAFTLGIDCFSRAGLKELYIYNLGYRNGLFPKLWVQRDGTVGSWEFPLMTIMQVELGLLAACFVIGAAIQYRILGVLHTKLEQMKQEEQERKDAEEEAKAAARFKDHEADLEKWEGKYGHGKGIDGMPLNILGKDGHYGSSSNLSLMRPTTGGTGEYTSLGQMSPTLRRNEEDGMEMMVDGKRSPGGQSVGMLPQMQLGDSISPALGVVDGREVTADEKERTRLLKEIEETRRSIDVLRAGTPSSARGLLSPSGSDSEFGESRTRRQSGLSFASGLGAARQGSPFVSEVESRKDKEWNEYISDRKLYTPPAGISPQIASSRPTSTPRNSFGRLSKIPDAVVQAMERRERTMSAYELGGDAEFGALSPGADGEESKNNSAPQIVKRHSAMALMGAGTPRSASPQLESRFEQAQMQRRAQTPPNIVGHAASAVLGSASKNTSKGPEARPRQQERTITHDELEARHRARMSQMQNPVTEEMREQIQLAEARAKYDKQMERERSAMAKKQAERERRISTDARPVELLAGQRKGGKTSPGDRLNIRNVPKEDGQSRAAQWRQSVTLEDLEQQARRAKADQARPSGGAGGAGDDRRRSTTMDAALIRDRDPRRQSRGPNNYVN